MNSYRTLMILPVESVIDLNIENYIYGLVFLTKLDNTGGARPFKILNVSSAIVLILLICCIGIFALISKFS